MLKGYDDAKGQWVVDDPYGELDLLTGQWAESGGSSGESVRYSYANMNPRWQVEGDGRGWAWCFDR